MTFGEKIKKLRTDKGWTQDELAEKLFVTRTAVSKWESDRGYPNIDSLKAISSVFRVTLDELLSSDEVLEIAQENQKNTEMQLREKVYGLVDICFVLLLFLPLFATKKGESIESATLLTLSGVALYLKTVFFAVVTGITLTGVLILALQKCETGIWVKIKTKTSLILGVVAVLLFIISLQPYAAVFAFSLLLIKAILLIKRR